MARSVPRLLAAQVDALETEIARGKRERLHKSPPRSHARHPVVRADP